MILAAMATAGCTFLPGAGPSTGAMSGGANSVSPAPAPAQETYALLPMSVSAATAMNAAMPLARAEGFLPDQAPPPSAIGPGDAVEVTIVSVNPSGFVDFAQSAVTPLATNTLPVQEVDAQGMISVPPLGRVRAAGMSVPVLESRLTERLAEVLVDPSVVIRVAERVSDRVSVIGQVKDSGRHSAGRSEARLLDLIGAAGGPVLPADELRLRLTRGNRTASLRLDRLFEEPGLNIRVWPGDVISLEAAISRYALIGTANDPGEYDWSDRRLTLARALAEGRGGDTQAADRRGVFVLRAVPRNALGRVAEFDLAALPDPAPTVMQFDFSSPTGLLAAQAFELRDDDLVYVSDSPVEEFAKVVRAVSGVVSPNQVTARVIAPD